MSAGLISLIQQGHEGFFETKNEKMATANKNREKIYQGKEIPAHVDMYHSWEKCDGFVKDVRTAMIAMAISSLVSIVLIILVEQAKLLFYQTSEQKYKETDIIGKSSSKVLRTKELTKTYGGKVKAVKGISFDIGADKEVLGLLGANGAGKSSTFNMVTMQVKRTSGDITIFG